MDLAEAEGEGGLQEGYDRVATLLVNLHAAKKGGGTTFPSRNVTIHPKPVRLQPLPFPCHHHREARLHGPRRFGSAPLTRPLSLLGFASARVTPFSFGRWIQR